MPYSSSYEPCAHVMAVSFDDSTINVVVVVVIIILIIIVIQCNDNETLGV